jgi:AcrR family transcriptional regulator
MYGEGQQKNTIRQQAIVDAARRIISTKGIENLTIRQIARDLRITDGALYRHFRSKNEIISLLIDEVEKTLLATIEEAAQKTQDPAQKLENIFLSHISYAEQRRGVTFIIINETLSIKDKSLQRRMFAVLGRYLKTIEAVLMEGVKSGKMRKGLNLSAASLAFFGAVQATVTLWALSGFRRPLGKSSMNEILSIYREGVVSG